MPNVAAYASDRARSELEAVIGLEARHRQESTCHINAPNRRLQLEEGLREGAAPLVLPDR